MDVKPSWRKSEGLAGVGYQLRAAKIPGEVVVGW